MATGFRAREDFTIRYDGQDKRAGFNLFGNAANPGIQACNDASTQAAVVKALSGLEAYSQHPERPFIIFAILVRKLSLSMMRNGNRIFRLPRASPRFELASSETAKDLARATGRLRQPFIHFLSIARVAYLQMSRGTRTIDCNAKTGESGARNSMMLGHLHHVSFDLIANCKPNSCQWIMLWKITALRGYLVAHPREIS